MKLTRKKRELLMNGKYYVHLEQIKPSEFIYGIMGVIENSPFDYEVSKMYGKREDVLNKITKRIIEHNKINPDQNVFTFKYDELNDAKIMEREFKYDNFYENYRVTALPAVFLSDMKNVSILSVMVKKNALQQQFIEKSKYEIIK